MRTEALSLAMSRVRADRGEQIRYLLLCLRVEETVAYAVYAEGRGGCALELLGTDPSAAEDAYGRILGGELSPVHLYDWVTDWRRECEKNALLAQRM